MLTFYIPCQHCKRKIIFECVEFLAVRNSHQACPYCFKKTYISNEPDKIAGEVPNIKSEPTTKSSNTVEPEFIHTPKTTHVSDAPHHVYSPPDIEYANPPSHSQFLNPIWAFIVWAACAAVTTNMQNDSNRYFLIISTAIVLAVVCFKTRKHWGAS